MATTLQAAASFMVAFLLVATTGTRTAAGSVGGHAVVGKSLVFSAQQQGGASTSLTMSRLKKRATLEDKLDSMLVDLKAASQPQEEPPKGDSSANSTNQDEEKKQAVDDLEASPSHFINVDAMPGFEGRWYRNPWALLDKPIYEINEPGDEFWDPYRQNMLKGDYPIDDDDFFFRFTLTEKMTVEGRNVPTPRGITGPGSNTSSFFGDGEQLFFTAKTAISFDFFKGQEAFKPVDWRIRITPVFDFTSLNVNELGVVNPNIKDGKNRHTGDISLQEALIEIHLFTWNDRYDFMSSEIGIFAFRSDFRGFIFDDIQAGVRIFGNADDNLWQYNAVFFNMLEKDTNSELNSFDDRDQQVFIANVYRQDFLVKGYNIMFSFHWNHDERSQHFNVNDFLTRPQAVGVAREKQVDAFYFGWAGEGHFGRFNVTHAFYQVVGQEENNAFSGQDTEINAQFVALEVSYDFDWLRLRVYGMYASGDDNPLDGDGEAFDAIVDAPNFAGGEFSFFNRQEIRLLGVGLTPRLSFLPDLTSSKFEGQANFVNPGLFLFGAAIDVELTPKWRAQFGVNYLRFAQTEPLEVYLQVEDFNNEIGWELFFGTLYRPLLTNNILLSVGASCLFPGDGMEKLYQSDEVLYSVFFDVTITY
ncbi:MAG: hypothetical protein ACI97A_004416 [Planctomycetota bacterium]|jgi:hypothetical protein